MLLALVGSCEAFAPHHPSRPLLYAARTLEPGPCLLHDRSSEAEPLMEGLVDAFVDSNDFREIEAAVLAYEEASNVGIEVQRPPPVSVEDTLIAALYKLQWPQLFLVTLGLFVTLAPVVGSVRVACGCEGSQTWLSIWVNGFATLINSADSSPTDPTLCVAAVSLSSFTGLVLQVRACTHL